MSCCYSAFELLLLGTWPSACYQRVDVLSQLLDSQSAFELLLLGTWPYASYHSVETFSSSYKTSYSAFELLLLGTWLSAYYQRVDILSQLLLDSSPCMSGSGIINHPLRDQPGLKTKKVNHHSSEYSSPATHVRQGSWGIVCVTRCMCEYSREHSRVYVQP